MLRWRLMELSGVEGGGDMLCRPYVVGQEDFNNTEACVLLKLKEYVFGDKEVITSRFFHSSLASRKRPQLNIGLPLIPLFVEICKICYFLTKKHLKRLLFPAQ